MLVQATNTHQLVEASNTMATSLWVPGRIHKIKSHRRTRPSVCFHDVKHEYRGSLSMALITAKLFQLKQGLNICVAGSSRKLHTR